MTTIVVVKKSI